MKKSFIFLFLLINLTAYALERNIPERYSIASKIFVTDFNNGRFLEIWRRGGRNFRLHVSLHDLEMAFKSCRKLLGKILSIEEPVFTANFCIFEVQFEKRKSYLIMLLDKDDKYVALSFIASPDIYGIVIYPNITDKTSVEDIAEVYMKLKANAGLAIGLYNEGSPEMFFYGTVKKGTNIKPDKNTEFEIGDVTEIFTAIALLELHIQNILNLNIPVSVYLPENVKLPSIKEKSITLENLVTNTSGLPIIPNDLYDKIKNSSNPYENYTIKEFYSFLNTYNAKQTSEKLYEYSNMAFGLIGHIMELRTGISFGQIVKKEICNKLGMKNTTVLLSTEQKLKLAQGYLVDGEPAECWKNCVLPGAVALKSTLSDLMLFLQENMSPGKDALGKAVKMSHKIKVIPDERDFKQASGWEVIKVADRNVIWKYGGSGGFRCGIAFFEETKTGVVILANSSVDSAELLVKLLEYLALKLDRKKHRNLAGFKATV